MVRDAFAQPGAQKAEEMFPNFVTKRLKPPVAGAAIVDGIESRAQMIIRPRWWRVYSVLRGILNPLLDRQSPNATTASANRSWKTSSSQRDKRRAGEADRGLVVRAGPVPDVELYRLDGQLHQARL